MSSRQDDFDDVAVHPMSPQGSARRLTPRGSAKVLPEGIPPVRTNSFMMESKNQDHVNPLSAEETAVKKIRRVTPSQNQLRQVMSTDKEGMVRDLDFDEEMHCSDTDSETEERYAIGAAIKEKSRRELTKMAADMQEINDTSAETLEYHNVSIDDIMERLETSYVYQLEPEGCQDRRLSIDPREGFMRRWDVVMLVCLLFVAIVTPFEISYLASVGTLFSVVKWIIDILFFADMFVNFFLSYFNNEANAWEFENWPIMKHYLKGWFIIDFMSIIPYDLFGSGDSGDGAVGQQLKMLKIIRLLRLIKLVRVVRASRLFKRLELNSEVSYAHMTMIKYLVVITVSTHWSACMWHLIVGLEDAPANWVNSNEANEFVSLIDASPASLYIAAFYSVLQALVMGFPNFIYPITTAERILAVVLMMFLGSIYGYVIGNICDLVSNLDPATSEFQNNMDHLNTLLTEIKYGDEERKSVREYFHHCRAMFRFKFYHELMERMSPKIQSDVNDQIHSTWVNQIPFFLAPNLDERADFINSIAMALHYQAYSPQELIIREGEFTRSMYIIKRGLVARLGRVLGAGRFFGEDVILRNSRRKYFVRVLTFLDVYRLDREDLDSLLESGNFEQTRKIIRHAAIRLALQRELCRIRETIRMRQYMGHPITEDVITEVTGIGGDNSRRASMASQGSDASGSTEYSHATDGKPYRPSTQVAERDEIPMDMRMKARKADLEIMAKRVTLMESRIQDFSTSIAQAFDNYRALIASSYTQRQAAAAAAAVQQPA